jgi:alkylation response protein AidB-like acyl-CoA dehydrogenase
VLLGFERFQIAEVPQSKRLLAQVKRLAARTRRGGRPLDGEPEFATALARAEIALAAHSANTLAFLARFQRDGAIGPEVSMLKVRGAEIRQALAALALRALGSWGIGATPDAFDRERWPGPPEAPARVAHFFYSRGSSIYGGSNEIQRDLLARALIG